MSLLAHTAWTSPMCGHARLIAAPHTRRRRPVWLQRFPHRSGPGPFHPDSTASLPLQCLFSPKNEGQKCRDVNNSKEELASHTLRRNRWSSIKSPKAGGSTVADMPCSTEAHTRFCDDHVLDGDAVSVPRVSLSSSPTAPSVQTEMGYPWNRCGMSCKLSPVRSHGLKPLRV